MGYILKPDNIFIAPSILSADFSQLGNEISGVHSLGAKIIHFDVMDGVFVPNISFGLPVLENLKSFCIKSGIELMFDVHLMIDKPERYVKDFIEVGGDIITFHFEATQHSFRVIDMIKGADKLAGVALNPGTSLCSVRDIFPYIDVLLLMSVNPGFGGQKFISSVLGKIKEANEMRKNGANYLIEVDGGLNSENCAEVIYAGANILVFGSFLFTGDRKEKFRRILLKIEEYYKREDISDLKSKKKI